MQAVIDFFQANWQYISAGILILFEVLILILKNRPQVVDTSLMSRLTFWIKEAEDLFDVGSQKLQYVLSCAHAYLGEKYIESEIKDLVEYLLSLPQKKGANNGEKKS